VAATSQLAIEIDDLQQRFREGPCLDAAIGNPMVMCNDLRESSTVALFRRGGSCSRCPQPDVVPALHPQRPHGGNEPFGIKPDVFTIESEAVGAMLATHAAIALIADDERLQFQSALASRDIIGQAKGKIMERFNVDAVRAFELLVKQSQNSNIRLAVVAEELVSRGPEPIPRNKTSAHAQSDQQQPTEQLLV